MQELPSKKKRSIHRKANSNDQEGGTILNTYVANSMDYKVMKPNCIQSKKNNLKIFYKMMKPNCIQSKNNNLKVFYLAII